MLEAKDGCLAHKGQHKDGIGWVALGDDDWLFKQMPRATNNRYLALVRCLEARKGDQEWKDILSADWRLLELVRGSTQILCFEVTSWANPFVQGDPTRKTRT